MSPALLRPSLLLLSLLSSLHLVGGRRMRAPVVVAAEPSAQTSSSQTSLPKTYQDAQEEFEDLADHEAAEDEAETEAQQEVERGAGQQTATELMVQGRALRGPEKQPIVRVEPQLETRMMQPSHKGFEAAVAETKNSFYNTGRVKGKMCSCAFSDVCSCQTAMEFMNCIRVSCSADSGCTCKTGEIGNACASIKSVCSGVALDCRNENAQCTPGSDEAMSPELAAEAAALLRAEAAAYPASGSNTALGSSAAPAPAAAAAAEGREAHEAGPPAKLEVVNKGAIYNELKAIKEEKCRLEVRVAAGWLNADRRLRRLHAQVAVLMKELEKMNALLPELSCAKAFEEWHSMPPQEKLTVFRVPHERT